MRWLTPVKNALFKCTYLSVRADLLKNLANLGLETHVQHSVGLVQHQIGSSKKLGKLFLKSHNLHTVRVRRENSQNRV